MAEKEITTTTEAPKDLWRYLNQIAADMGAIQDLVRSAADEGSYNHIDHAIDAIASRSGALADKALKEIGKTQCVGDFEKWMV